MIVCGHQTIDKNIYMLAQILFNSAQKIQIISALKEHFLTIVAAIVEVIILVR
jgi:hypothetical protein